MTTLALPGWAQALLAGALGLGFAYATLLAALFAFQRHILFRPDREVPDMARAAVAGLEAVSVRTTDGLALLAWFLPPRADRPVVLYLHGNAGHVGHRSERVRAFAAHGWGALLVQYRGYGGNPGAVSEAGLRLDAAAALAALRARGFPERRILVWGESLGSGLATWLAAREAVGAVVLETPFTSIADIAKARYPYAPVDLLLHDRFDSLAEVPRVRAPVLVMVAGRDRVVPPAMGRALHAAAPAGAELWEAPDGGHTDLLDHGAMAAAASFVARRMALADSLRAPAGVATTVP